MKNKNKTKALWLAIFLQGSALTFLLVDTYSIAHGIIFALSIIYFLTYIK